MEKVNSHWWQAKEAIPSITADELFNAGPFTIANSTMFTFLIIIVFIILAVYARRFKMIPSYFQHLCEMMYESVLDLLSQIVGGKDHARQIIPVAGSIFVYILLSNLLPMIPGISSFTYNSIHIENGVNVVESIPLFRGGTADFNTTFGLALASVFVIQIIAIKNRGIWGHVSHFIQIDSILQAFTKSKSDKKEDRKTISRRVGLLGTGLIHFMVGLIEIVGEIAKVISLSLRLFGNMFAHEILTIIIMGSIAIAVPVLWMGMGLIVGIVQAIVFTSLITVYYNLNRKAEH